MLKIPEELELQSFVSPPDSSSHLVSANHNPDGKEGLKTVGYVAKHFVGVAVIRRTNLGK